MDFGLAQEVNANTQTLTGGIEGTPAFMAPEQARGETRLLDRRTDVYGLGATLYTVLAGRPPFTGSSTEVLLAVMFNEPPPLRNLDPAVPGDLETIVLKCLEKDPQRRYDSAKALADDLARFLEGARIAARPPGLRQRLGKVARRHKLLVASFSAALIASLVLGSIALRLRWQAATQARLAQELGQDIKELEMFMRSAYGLPVHDIAREQAVVRSRMARFTSTLRSASSQAAATLRYALGRSHLVLREYPEAQAALEASWQGGYRTPAARLALGLVLGERYRQELEQAQRVGDKQWIEQREQALFTQYLQPALAYLEGASSSIEAPSYIAGLLQFYRKQYDSALTLAQRAQAEAPWLAEPLRLEGDVYQVQGIRLVDRGRRGEGRALLLRAAERHHLAAEISRSDSAIYAAEAVDWIRAMEVDSETGAALDEAEKGALTAIASAIRCDPRAAYGFQLQGWAYWRLGRTKRMRKQGGEFELQQSVAAGEKAVAMNPLDWQSYYYHSLGLAELARLARHRGEDAGALNQKAVAALQQTIKINKNFAWAWNDLGNLYYDFFRAKTIHGELDASLYAEALSCLQKAAQLDPSYAKPHRNLANLISEKIDFLLLYGKNIESDAALATAAVNREMSLKPDRARGYAVASAILLNKITYASLCQAAPSELFAEESKVLAELRDVAPASKDTDLAYATFYSLRATRELTLGHDPTPAIVAGLQAVADGEKKDATNFSFAAYKARFYTSTGRALGSQESADRAFAQAVVAAQRAVALLPNDAEPYDILCEAFRHAAAARGNRRKLTAGQNAETTSWIERGLDACTAAIAINTTRATAYGNGGALFLLQAQREVDPAAAQLAAARATDALGQALALNQCLGREYGSLLETARALDRKTKISGARFGP